MDSTAIEQEAEALLRDAARELTEPREGECLLCFVSRMIDDFGCDTTLRWAARFRDLRAPRATALAQRLGDIGGFCDCEIFLNGYRVAVHLCEEDEWGDLVPSGTPVLHWRASRLDEAVRSLGTTSPVVTLAGPELVSAPRARRGRRRR